MSGGRWGLATAGVVTFAAGGCAYGLLVVLAGISWLLAALVAVACLFMFYAVGAYRVWDKAESERSIAVEERDADRAKPRGPIGISVVGEGSSQVRDNTVIFHAPYPQSSTDGQPKPN